MKTRTSYLKSIWIAALVLPILGIVFISCTPSTSKQSDGYGKLLYSFQVMGDTEVVPPSQPSSNNAHFSSALNAVKHHSPNSSAIFIVGDVTSAGGNPAHWKQFAHIIDSIGGLPKVYSTLGNHDLTDGGPYQQAYENYLKYSGMPGTYYDEWIGGNHFIAIASEDAGHNVPIYSEKQLAWLEEKLAENASSDKPIFLFSHYSIRNTTAGTYLGTEIGHSVGSDNKLRLMELLKKYPQVVYFTGHTHFAVNAENAHYNIDTKNGLGADMFCSGAVSYMCTGTYRGYPEYSYFLFVDVYEEAVVVRGYDIMNNKFMSDAVYVINTQSKMPTETKAPKIELESATVTVKSGKPAIAYITFEDEERVLANDGAWVGVVSNDAEGKLHGAEFETDKVLRYAMLKDLQKDSQGRYVWDLSDDAVCGVGTTASWESLISQKGTLCIGLFEDILYLGQKPTVPTFDSYLFDPWARLAKARLEVVSESKAD